METSLPQTKLHVPSVRPDCIARPRLIDQLEDGADGRLILVSAPAGSGRTTLIAEWLQAKSHATAWLSLDEGDSSIVQFWTYAVSALQTVQSQIGQMVLASLTILEGTLDDHSSTIRPALQRLINELTRLTAPVFLLLDDYHLITSSEFHRSHPASIDCAWPNCM